MTDLIAKLDALYEKATKGPWEMYQTARPRHFEIGPSQRRIVAMMTNDGTEDNDFGYDNARFLQALVNAYPQLRELARGAKKLAYAEHCLKVISESEVSKDGMLIADSGKCLRQIAINYFTNSVMEDAIRKHIDAAMRGGGGVTSQPCPERRRASEN